MAIKTEDVKEEVQQEESIEKEQSTQEESTSTAESNTEALSNLTSDQYKEWRLSGKLPESKEKESTETKKVVKKEPVKETVVDEEEEEAPKPPKKASRSEARKDELNEEIRNLATKRQQEEKALNDILEKKKKAAEPPEEKKEEPKTISLKDLVAKVKARADKGEFASYEEVVAATAETLIEERGVISESKLQKMLSDAMDKFKTDWAKEQKDAQEKTTVETQRKAQETEWVNKVNEAEKKHPDYKEVCFSKDSPAARIKSGSPLDRVILKHKSGAELLYHVCSIEGEVERINSLDPDLDQPTEIKDIITKFSGEPEKETPPPPTTRAKKPPTEASGRSSATVDASEAALKNKDVGAYMLAENAKEQARRKAALGLK
jgi:hypothetical protein